MLGKTVQIRLEDVYDGVLDKVEERQPELLTLLEEHIDFEKWPLCSSAGLPMQPPAETTSTIW